MISLATQRRWKIYQLDVKSAFLNSFLEEEIYVEQPLRYIEADNEGKYTSWIKPYMVWSKLHVLGILELTSIFKKINLKNVYINMQCMCRKKLMEAHYLHAYILMTWYSLATILSCFKTSRKAWYKSLRWPKFI